MLFGLVLHAPQGSPTEPLISSGNRAVGAVRAARTEHPEHQPALLFLPLVQRTLRAALAAAAVDGPRFHHVEKIGRSWVIPGRTVDSTPCLAVKLRPVSANPASASLCHALSSLDAVFSRQHPPTLPSSGAARERR